MGTRARVGEIAVDPRVIPLGSKVYIEGVGARIAEDTGGNIKGNTIDIYMNSVAECRKWGARTVTIYIPVSYTHLDVYKRQVFAGAENHALLYSFQHGGQNRYPQDPGSGSEGFDQCGKDGNVQRKISSDETLLNVRSIV